MSYALRDRFVSHGIATLTVPGNDSLTSANVAVTGMKKTDTVLVTFNQNENIALLTVTQVPWLYNQVDGGFNVVMNLVNGDAIDAYCSLNWAVIR